MKYIKIIGIDPGIASTGYGVIVVNSRSKAFKKIDYGVIATKPNQLLQKRLQIIYRALNEILDKHRPDQASIESIFFFRNQKSLIGVSQAIGVISICIYQSQIPCEQYTPLQVKKNLFGYGRASKTQVQEQVKKELHLRKMPKPQHSADALAIAICHAKKILNIKD